MKLHLSRFVCLDVASNLVRMEQEGARAAASGADLCVFPEAFLHGYRRQLDPALARARFRTLSGDCPDTAFLFGSITEDRRNRLTVWQGGEQKASYDKVHLFRPTGEFDLWQPGDRYAAVRLKDWTLGLLTCNDLRFPEQARALLPVIAHRYPEVVRDVRLGTVSTLDGDPDLRNQLVRLIALAGMRGAATGAP